MNKEEKIYCLYKQINNDIQFDNNWKSGFKTGLGLMHDCMEKDFESRTCKNCKHHKKKKLQLFCSLGIAHFEIDENPTSFGCSKFESIK